jgi:hypothetical protein
MRLRYVLSRTDPLDVTLPFLSTHDLKLAARFWCGKTANGMRQADLAEEIGKVFENRQAVTAVMARLSAKERDVLAVVSRFGTGISGSLLAAELASRNLTAFTEEQGFSSFYSRRSGDAASAMIQKLAFLKSSRDSGVWEFSQRAYPDVRIPALAAELAKPAAPLPWPSEVQLAGVSTGVPRSLAEVAVDLLKVAEALRSMKSWQTVRGGMLSKNAQKKIAKFVPLPTGSNDPQGLPDPWAFYYETLRVCGFLNVETQTIRDSKLQELVQAVPFVLSWNFVRAWLNFEFWQDGAGMMGAAHRFHDPARLLDGRSLVVWALGRVAHSPHEWFDLEQFAIEFYRATRLQPISWEFRASSWKPQFERSRDKEKLPGGRDRTVAYWLENEGTWVANAVIVTFVELGLIERGHVEGQPHRHCFRLTAAGRVVFGGPEIDVPEFPAETRFLAVLPNHDVLAYLDTADTRALELLTRIAECTSTAGKVQTFALRREFVYRAMESGRTVAAIRSYLEEHGRTPLPPTVDRALTEWAGKRDSLVVRSGVTVAVDPAGALLGGRDLPHRRLGETSVILGRLTAKEADHQFGAWLTVDHTVPERRTWTVTETGLIRAGQIDSVARVRLSLFAEHTDEGWHVTRDSVRTAFEQRLTVDQILEWLGSHLTHAIPPLLKTAIRNWSKPESVFLGKVHVLQVPSVETCSALVSSPTFMRLTAERIPPRWFLIHDENWAKVKKLLLQLGFSFNDSWHSPAATLETVVSPPAKVAPAHAARKTRPR